MRKLKGKEIRACIFDLDGVLCDTAKYHYLAWKQLAEKLGIKFTQEDNERLKGVSRMDSLDILLSLGNREYTKVQKRAFAEEKNTNYVASIMQMNKTDVFPGVLEMLLYCRNKNIKVALGSVSKNAKMILDKLELNSLFDLVIDGTNVVNAKPDPEVFLKGADGLGVLPEYCIVFEDAAAGIEAAKRAGMRTVGVGSAAVLSEADFVIADFTDSIMQVILEGCSMVAHV